MGGEESCARARLIRAPTWEADITCATTGLAGVMRMMMAGVVVIVVVMMGLGESRCRNQHHRDKQQRQKLLHGPDYSEEIPPGNAPDNRKNLCRQQQNNEVSPVPGKLQKTPMLGFQD